MSEAGLKILRSNRRESFSEVVFQGEHGAVCLSQSTILLICNLASQIECEFPPRFDMPVPPLLAGQGQAKILRGPPEVRMGKKADPAAQFRKQAILVMIYC